MARPSPHSTPTRRRRSSDQGGCCSLSFLRYILFVFNVIFWLTGLAFLGVGLWTVTRKHDYISLLGTSLFSTATYLFLAIGVLVLLIGVLGCVGACRNVRCCLVSYAFLLLVIFLLEAVAGILAYMNEGMIREELTRNLNTTMLENYHSQPDITSAVDRMQEQFHCCGAGSYEDWRYSKWLINKPDEKRRVPDSCCISPSFMCAKRTHPSNIYWMGCSPQLELYVKQHLILLGGVGLGICLIQIFGIVFACCLARKIKESKEGY